MATIRPILSEDQVDNLRSKAEAKLYRACRDQLPNHILVIFSAPFIHMRRSESSDGEADFVILDPKHGMLVIEVKGGGVRWDREHDKWESCDRNGILNGIKNPFEQAKKGKYALLNCLRKPGSTNPLSDRRLLAGHAVFFPDIDDVKALVTPQSPIEIIGSYRDLADLSAWVQNCFYFWAGDSNRWQSLGADGVSYVINILCTPLTVRPILSTTLKEEELCRIRLTEQQTRVLHFIGARKKALICGGAGTGKTILALNKARELAESGRDTLLVCYNRPLADLLASSNRDVQHLHIMDFHQLCYWLAGEAKNRSGRDLFIEARRAYPTEDEYDCIWPYALALAVEALDIHYDSIIVDEGQDFLESFWLPLEMLIRDEKESIFYIFYDQNQAIYHCSQKFPFEDDPFLLSVNCRNTKYIHEAAYRFFVGDRTDPPSLDGSPPTILDAPSPPTQLKRIHQYIVDLIVREKVAADDIAILVPGAQKEFYCELLEQQKWPAGISCKTEAANTSSSITMDTIQRFKGREANVVFVWGLDHLNPDEDRETLYVATSRAKSRLILVGMRSACERVLKQVSSKAIIHS